MNRNTYRPPTRKQDMEPRRRVMNVLLLQVRRIKGKPSLTEIMERTIAERVLRVEFLAGLAVFLGCGGFGDVFFGRSFRCRFLLLFVICRCHLGCSAVSK